MSDPNNAALSSTERARRSRRRKREGLRLLRLEIRDAEVGTLVKVGLLRAEKRDDIAAVAKAVHELFDVIFPALEAGELQI